MLKFNEFEKENFTMQKIKRERAREVLAKRPPVIPKPKFVEFKQEHF